jgi:hypothetical protein
MAANIERFKKDLERLLQTGQQLDAAMVHEVDPTNFMKQITKQLGDKAKAEALVQNLPDFKRDYEGWYSECLALLRQVLPDRPHTFVALYEKPRPRKSLPGYSEYVIEDYMDNLVVTRRIDVKANTASAVPKFRQQLAILSAAERRFTSALFEIRQLVQADLFDSEIDAARELAKHKYLRAAGAIAGVWRNIFTKFAPHTKLRLRKSILALLTLMNFSRQIQSSRFRNGAISRYSLTSGIFATITRLKTQHRSRYPTLSTGQPRF